MPQGLSYVPGTSVAVSPANWALEEPSIVEIADGFQELNWQLPPNMPVNAIAQVDFKVDATNYAESCGSQGFGIETYTFGFLGCGDIAEPGYQVCFVEILTGNSIFNLTVEKPNLQFLQNQTDIYATCSGGPFEQLNTNIALQNYGIATLPGDYLTIKYIHDANANGVYDAADALLDTYVYTDVINAGQIINIERSILVSGGQACPLLLYVDDSENCVCLPSNLFFPEVQYDNVSDDVSVCSGASIELGCVAVPGYHYTWIYNDNYGNHLSCTDCANPIFSLENNTNQPITQTYTLITQRGNLSTSCTSSQSVTITITPSNNITANAQSVCEGQSIQLNGPAGGSQYSWLPLNGFGNPYVSNPIITPPVGTTTYILSYLDAYGCDATYSITIETEPLPEPEVIVSGDLSTCAGAGEIVLDAGAGYYSYAWFDASNPTAPIPVGSNQLFAPTVSGDYYVVVVSNTANQCEGVSSPPIPVTINEYVKPTILANGETEVCGGESVTLFIAGNYTNVQWYTENNPPPAQPVHTGLSFTTSTSGNYFVTATDENGCNGSSEPIIVTVHSLQAINITVANNDTDLCTGESVVLSVPNIFDEYMWTLNGNVISAAGNTLTVSQSGTYAIKAIDLNGCEVISDPVTITVHQFTPPQISAVGSTTVCEGQSVTFAVFGNYAQIQWYNANNPPPSGIVLGTGNVFTTTVSGNYLVYVSDNNGCSGTSTPATANILPPNATLSLLTNPIQDICEGETANLQVASGFFNYTWYHNGAIVSGSLNSFVASTGGTYFVTAQTFDGCEVMSETFTITVYPIPQPGIEVDGEQQFCEGENIILTLTEPHETYQWYRNGTAIPNATNEELIVSQNGNYYAVVSDNNCPGQTFEIPITVYPLPQVSITAGTNPVCEGETVSLTSSAGNYATRQWLRNGLLIYQANQSTITVSEPGIYSLEVTDANGCSNISNDIEIEFNPTPEVAIMLGGDNTFCEGGSVTAIATAGYVSYQWFVNGVATQNGASNQITIAQTTEVSVVATDVNACQGTAVPVQIITTPLPQPQIIAPITEICAGETATLAVQGAYPFVQWYLNDQLIPTATSSIIEVSQAGNYTVYVNNLNGCEGTSAPVSISVNPLPQPQFLETEFLVCGNDQLPITLVVAGNYNYYTWYKNGVQVVAQGNTTSTYQAYDAGIYTVEVTNANGCKGITGDAAEITVVPDMPVNLTADKYEICPGEVVEFDANANAEIFAWTPNDGSLSCLTCARPVATPTQTTTYTLTITDDFGCQKTESVTIIVHPEPNVNLTITDPEICEGQISSMVATAGFQNYDFYRNGITLVQSGTNNVLVTSEAGVYTVIATNQYGCSKPSSPQSLIVHDLPTPSLNIAGNINLCEGGSVSINTEVYSAYVWYLNDNVINGANNNVVTISQSGNVYVKVTDENGCEGTSSVVYIDVNSNPQPSVLAEQTEICQGETAELAVLGGYASVQWYLNGSIIPTGTSNNYFAVQSGAYTVSVTDFEGCSATSSAINIVVNPLPQVAVVPVNTEICQEDGETVLLTATPGYSTYNWYLNGGALVQSSSSNTYNAGQSGTYTVKVINENGCEGQSNGANILLKSIPPVNAGATDTQICLGESTQLFVNSNASNISWSPVQSLNCLNCPNPVATPTQTTTYTVSITDEEGCTATDQVTVQVLNTVAPSISVLGDIAVCQGESISLQASGGYVQYTWYKENGVIVQNGASSVFTTQVGGSYYVTAIGATGCPATSNMVAISFYEQPTVSIEFLSQNTFCEGGSVMLEANNNFSNYQWYANGILLQSGANNQFEVSNSANVYVVATNSNGCVAQSSTVVVNTNPLPNPVIIAPVTEICVGETTTLAVQGVYGEIQWYRNNVAIPTGTDNNLEVSQSGAYTVYVNDLAGCEGTSPVVQIIVNPLPTPHLVETSFLVCGETDLPVVLAVQESYAYYTWYYNGVEIVGQGAALQTFEAYSTGIYSVEVTNDKGCKAMSGETVNVLVPPSLPVNLTADKYEICPGEVVEFDANANAETFSWMPNNGSLNCLTCARPVATPTQTTTYTLTITDSYGCEKSESVTIVVKPTPNIVLNIGEESVCAGETTLITATQGFDNYKFYLNGITLVQAGSSNTLTTGIAGTYSVEVSDAEQCPAQSNTVSLSINENPEPTISLLGELNLCEGGNVSLQTTSDYAAYQWYINGQAAAGQTSPSIVLSNTAMVFVEVTDYNGCVGASASVFVNVSDNPEPTVLVGDIEFCQGESTTLAVLGNFANIQWFRNGAAISTAVDNTLTVTQSGNYTVAVTDLNNCSAVSSAIQIEVLPLPQVALTPVYTEICQNNNQPVTLTATFGYSQYNWYRNGNALVQTGTSNTYNAILNGTYVVEAINANGCSNTSNGVQVEIKEIPPVNIGATDTQICVGESSILFINSNASQITWSPATGLSCTTCANPIATPNATTTYTATIVSEEGCTASESITINVNSAAIPQISVSNPEICGNGGILLTATAGYNQYTWQNEQGVIVQQSSANTYTAYASGTYTVSVQTIGGCNAVSAPTEITIHSNPTVNISVSSEGNFCDGNVFTLTADAGFVNYVWYLNNTIVNGNNTNSILLQTSANVYVTVTDNNGCTASSPILVLSTNSTPTPEIVISSGDFCEGGSTLLSIPGNYSNYKWYKDGALIPTATTASLAVTEAGSYAVYVNNGAGCEGISNPVQIQTIGLPEVSITPANTELFICADSDELNLTATPGFDFYTWYRNGVTLVQAGPSNQLMVSIPGEYSVMVSNEQGCSAMSNSTSIYLYPNPPVNLYASDTHICAGESVQLSVNQDAVSYQWLPNNNTISCADCFNPVVTPLVSTDYYITIVDYNGCTSSDTVHIEVESAASIQITGNESLCIGQGSATLSATAGLNNYQWYFNGDAIYQATQATYTTNMAGDYQVEAQVGECIILSQVFTVNDLALPSPEISISGYNFCENNNSITLDAGNGYDTYEWINADTEAVLGTTQTLTITQDGNYYVSVSKNTCLGTSTVISIESSNFENPLIYTENNNACDGEPVSLIVPGVYSSVTWYNAANPSQALNEYTTNVYETMLPGNYYAEVTAQDGCSGTTPIVEVNIHTIPTTTITPELSYLCEGSTVTLQPTSLEGITAFQWYHNGFEIPNATQPQLITDLTGTFALEVINTITGCSSMTDAVEVIPAQVQALACDIPAMACMNEEVPLFLLGNPANPQSITWNFDNATIVSSQNNTQFVLQWETFGLKTISYTYTLANGCLQSGSCTILITEPPVEVDPIVENATDCQDNGSIILSVTNKDAISVSWSGPNGFTSNETSIYNLAPGTYVAHISYNGACPLDDIVVVIENESVAPNPIALDDYATLTNGETTYINVLQNDLGENIQLSGIIQYPNVGTAQIVSNTTISYIAPLGFTGQVELQYTITSLCETSATATVYITVTSAVNANNDLAILCDGNSIAINVLANDEGEGIYVSSISGNTDFGSIIIDENFNLIYVPNGNFNGSDEFTYNVSDPYGNTDQAIVNILCNEVNSPPLTDTIEVCTQPVTPVVFCFDLEDPDGDNVMITEGHTTYHCSLVILNDSCVRYTPLPGLTGIDTVFLEVCDTHIPTACNEVVAIVNIGCSQPDAVDDYMYFTCNETSNTINVLDNDMLNYVCDEEYNMTIVSGPLHGSASNLGGGLFSYTPQQDYSGTDEIEYVLCNSCGKCDTAFVHINIPTCGGSCNDGFETICVAPQQNINICPQFCTLNNDPTAFISSAITDIPCYLDLDDMCINYQSQAGFEGIQQIKVTACNTSGYCETVFINITVSYDCISTPIDAIKDYYTTYQSTSIQFNPLINDSGSPFNVSNYGQPLHGTLNTYNGVWDYTPANGFTGVDTLYYTICNAQGNCDTAPVCIEVLPTCSQYTFTCAEPGTMVSICPEFCNLPDNAQISNIQTLFLCSIDYTGGNCFTYQPMPYYSYGQKDTLKVTACAGTQCETAYIVLQIGCAVQVYDDYLTTTPEATITIDATENDIVPCDGAPIISIIENGLHGIASIDEDGLIVYQPANDGYLGNDIITYQSCSACDDTMCDTGYIIFTIADTDAIAQNDASQTYINSSVSIDVMENDVQPGNNPLEMFTWSQPQNGTVAWVNGIFIYTPNDNFLGTDTFEYQVCADAACATAQVNIEVVDNILAMNDIYTIPANTAATLNVLDNDYGNSVQITTVSANANANISIDSDNTSITIIPNANFEGVLSFEYTICSNNICDEATVNVLVNNNTAAPVALNDAYVTYVNEAINLDILANDINVDEFTTLTIIENTNHGQIEILENNQLLYTPNQNYIGNDVMLYQICDFNDNCHLAYVNITVLPTGNLAALNDWVTTPQNTAVTVSVSQNDINVADNATITIATAPQNGIAVVNQDGSIFYQPDADFAGIDNLIYEICNGSDCVQASLSIEVIASEAITAADDTAETSMNTNVNIDVLANDNYPVENFTLIISSIPQNGTAIVNADGSVDYLPNTGFVGEDTFSYELCSGGECVTAEVTVTVLSIEAKPVAQNDFVTTNVNTEINIFVLQNDTDPDNLSLSITEVSNAEHGTVNINAGHTITYMPDADFVGSDYFEYTICNTNNECAIATVFVEVVDCKISIPNGFSPNGDSTNDRFEVANVDCISDATLQVFNRWGDEVFYTEDVNARTWDGTWQKNNEPLPVGTYFYILSGNLNGNPVKYTGYIMLRR
ncbi:MAG: Ig-like domain-containing protein [Chitinophagales bacterium]